MNKPYKLKKTKYLHIDNKNKNEKQKNKGNYSYIAIKKYKNFITERGYQI